MIASVLRLREAESTQDLAKAMAEQGAAEGTLVRADRQTGGRGRLDRVWKSPEGGLYFSLILRPRFAPAKLAEFGLMAGECVARALEKTTGIRAAIKPPNDVLIDGRKVCGILCEAAGGARGLAWLVLGVGINVNNKAPQAAATSLRAVTKKSWPLDAVLDAVVADLSRAYRRFS